MQCTGGHEAGLRNTIIQRAIQSAGGKFRVVGRSENCPDVPEVVFFDARAEALDGVLFIDVLRVDMAFAARCLG
jgi:hypothetical protein